MYLEEDSHEFRTFPITDIRLCLEPGGLSACDNCLRRISIPARLDSTQLVFWPRRRIATCEDSLRTAP